MAPARPWSGTCDAETQRLAALSHDDPAAFDPRTHGVTLMRGQQRFGPEWIGEFCALTTVLRDSVATEILERW